ncbi:MAG: dipicolinate synthase subunit DpsA [Lachnospiraceae bacterium]|nr:dipicolinate synthase subunit DpsA [Lachnospiraceae bacterium]
MNHYHFLVLGTEPRQKYLAELLQEEGHEVMTADEYQPGYHDAVLLPVPQTARYLAENAAGLQKGQIVYGCNFPKELVEECKSRGIRFVDYMKEEGVASRNAIATAEGAIAEALQEGHISIHGSHILVAGYGRCGEVLVEKLISLKGHVTVLERKSEKRARACAYGCQAISFDKVSEKVGEYDFIFNTVPALVLTEELLRNVKQDVTIIDIASRPGGVDYEFCRRNEINAKLCLGLPGKYAPKSAAKILLEVIEKTILGD